jgi:hypothetical protein
MEIEMNEKAFPNPHRTDELGMTMRDYFAAKAMQGFMGSSWNNKTFESISTKAYQIADAMMKAREA